MATFVWHTLAMTEAELRKAIEAFGKAEQAFDKARQQRDVKIAQAAREDMRPTDIVAATGYTREHIRRILRAQGIEANR